MKSKTQKLKHQFLLLYISFTGLLIFGFIIIALSLYGLPRQNAASDKQQTGNKVAEIFQAEAGDATFTLVPSTSNYVKNQVSTLTVRINTNGNEVDSADLLLKYDKTKVSVLKSGMTLNSLFDDNINNTIDNSGFIQINSSFHSPLDTYKGEGIFATINFIPIDIGSSNIDFVCSASAIYGDSQNLLQCVENGITVSVKICIPNSTQCVGTTQIKTCNADGTAWSDPEDCVSGTCSGTSCTTSTCNAGDTKCSDGKVQICNADGTAWNAPEDCGIDKTCYESKCCDIDCSCASDTCTGSTCSNGCGGTCDGTKSCTAVGGPEKSIGCDKEYPARPTNLKAVPGTESGTVKLTWTRSTSTVTHYAIAYGEKWMDFTWGDSNIGNTDQYLVRGLRPGVLHYFVVTANNDCASSGYSDGANAYAAGGSGSGGSGTNKIIRPTPRPSIRSAYTPIAISTPEASETAKPSEWDEMNLPTPIPDSETEDKGSMLLLLAKVLPVAGVIVLIILGVMLVKFIKGGDEDLPGTPNKFSVADDGNMNKDSNSKNEEYKKDPLAPPFT